MEQLLSEEESWCGRYILVAGTRVLLDAVGALGVFFSEAGISSDIGLLAGAMGVTVQPYAPAEQLNWCPAPMTACEGISRLLASQIYDFASGAVAARRLLARSWRPCDDDNALLARVTEVFCQSLRNMEACLAPRKLMLAVTGGYDSRTLLALAVKAGISMEAFTLDRPQLPDGDREIPRALCERLGLPYTFIPRDETRYDAARERAYVAHCAGMVRDKDCEYYAYGQYDELARQKGEIALLRSNIWAIAKNSYRRYFSEETTAQEILDLYSLARRPKEKTAIEAYMTWCGESPQGALNGGSRFYWEQRMGCWMAETEHGFDLYEHIVSLNPLNCRLLLTMLFDFPAEERNVCRHQKRITCYACPQLSDIPYGGNTPFAGGLGHWIAHKFRRGMMRLRNIGLKGTVRAYGKILRDMRKTRRNRR